VAATGKLRYAIAIPCHAYWCDTARIDPLLAPCRGPLYQRASTIDLGYREETQGMAYMMANNNTAISQLLPILMETVLLAAFSTPPSILLAPMHTKTLVVPSVQMCFRVPQPIK